MRSFDRLPSRIIRLLVGAAILAALLVPLLTALADDSCPPGGCPLPPPQSREVNPAPARADGSAVEVATAGDLPPIEITVHVLAPAFGEPAPIGTSIETIAVPVRYQDPGDVSCGVQALGMALDALPGAAPTSSAMLGLLQDNGMMYDFGTGLEELAYAAQSYGYKGSFAFHSASLDQLQAQLATGNPVVVSLGANGEAAPGHFVTVTGISADGESHGDASRWVAFNDPTLGKQVLPASEFARLWEMQGNSGVAVATEPPADVPDPDNFALWTAFVAGLMALVSTTPLGALRSGVGGRLDSGATGGGRGAPAPRSAPPKKEKEKEKEPKKPKARFDDEIAVVSAPPKATKARFDGEPPPPPTPKPAPKPRFDEERVQPRVSTTVAKPRFDEEPKPALVFAQARFDEERDPDPRTATVAGKPRFDDEPVTAPVYPMARFDEEGKPSGEPDSVRLTPSEIIKWDTRALKVVRGIERATASVALALKKLDGGYISVSAPSALRKELGLAGTRYLPSTVARTTGSSLIRGAAGKSNLIISGVAAIGTNLYDYGLGDHKDEGIGSQEFWVSTGVDFGAAITIGVAAAMSVALVGVGITALMGAVVSAPVLIGDAMLAGLVAGVLVEAAGIASATKEGINEFIDERELEADRIPEPPGDHPAPKSPPAVQS